MGNFMKREGSFNLQSIIPGYLSITCFGTTVSVECNFLKPDFEMLICSYCLNTRKNEHTQTFLTLWTKLTK